MLKSNLHLAHAGTPTHSWHPSPHSWLALRPTQLAGIPGRTARTLFTQLAGNLHHAPGTHSPHLASTPVHTHGSQVSTASRCFNPHSWLVRWSAQLVPQPTQIVTPSTQLAGTQALIASTDPTQMVPPRATAPAGRLLLTVPCSLPWGLCWPLNTPQVAILFSLDKRSLSYTERG